MDETLGIIIGTLGFTALLITPFIVNKVVKYKMEIAKLNAETTIKTEEIRARNQLEIEKLVCKESNESNGQVNSQNTSGNFANGDEYYEKPDRNRVRL